MVQITCQYTGIEFEAASKRQKNHPDVSELLNEAANHGFPGEYGAAKELLAECKQAGMTDIAEALTYVRAGLAKARAKQQQAERERLEAIAEHQRRIQAAKTARAEQNAFLRQHGYVWRKNDMFDFDHYEEPNGEYIWELIAPDGKVVDVKQALDEIDRGREVVRAEIAAREAAEKQAAAEAEIKRNQAREEGLRFAEQVAAETGLPREHDWSWDDYRFRLGDTIAVSESGHWVARQYFDSNKLIGFVIESRNGMNEMVSDPR